MCMTSSVSALTQISKPGYADDADNRYQRKLWNADDADNRYQRKLWNAVVLLMIYADGALKREEIFSRQLQGS